MSFFAELKRRNVFRVGIAYVVAAWLLLQLTEVLTELLELSTEVGKLVIVLLVIGFVPVLIFAWAFELTPEGLKREHEVDRTQSITRQTGRKLDFTIIGMLALVAAYFIWESRFMHRPVQQSAAVAPAEAPAEPTADRPQSATPAPRQRSIAVLPFANRSRLEDDQFFTDGIHDDLLTQLAKINDIKVVSRTSVMKYKGTEKTIPEIARELSVATILEGGIQRAGQRIRINAQLIDVAGDKHLWAETFDREMTVENIFEIQSEITRQIVQAVRGELTEEERLNLARLPTTNLEAYEAYLRALSLTSAPDYSQDIYINAELWARRAVELDPAFAQAWSMLVKIHGQAVWIGYDTSPERFRLAAEALEKARRLGPELPETIAAAGDYAYRIEEDFSRALTLYRQALRAMPGDAGIAFSVAVAQRRTRDLEGALASFERALEIDPNFSRVPPTILETLVFMDAVDRAGPLADEWVLRFPDSQDIRVWRAQILLQSGQVDQARAQWRDIPPSRSGAYWGLTVQLPFFERDYAAARATWERPEIAALAENRGNLGWREVYRGWAHRLAGEPAAAEAELRRAVEIITSAPAPNRLAAAYEAMTLALAHALLGQEGPAIAAAERGLQQIPRADNEMAGTFNAQSHAQVLAILGRRDEALALIEQFLETPYRFSRWLLYLDPRWDFFRDDPRFNDLIRPEDAP